MVKCCGILETMLLKWKSGTLKEVMDDWKWIFHYSIRYKWAIIFYTVCGVISTSMGLVSSVSGKYLIDIITGRQTERLGILMIVLLGSSVSGLVFRNLLSRISARLSIAINNDIQTDVFERILDAQWSEINRYAGGDILNRFSNDIGIVSNNAVSWLPSVLIAIYNFATTFLVILHYDRTMAVIALISAPFLLLISRFMMKKQRIYGKKVRELSSDSMSFETEVFYNYDTIKSFGAQYRCGQKLHWWQQRSKKINLEYNLFSIRSNVALSLSGLLVQFISFGYCLFLLWSDEITFGTMTLFLQQRSNLSAAFQNMTAVIPAFLNSAVSAHRIRELAEIPGEIHINADSVYNIQNAVGMGVRMRKIQFAYVNGIPVIKVPLFQAVPGEIVALVGPSGEGKTTMLRLLLGLVQPQQGEAVLTGVNDWKMPLNAESRKFFAYVPQGNTMFAGTIAENMRLGKSGATEEEIILALKQACAWEFVKKMPDLLDTELGERGRGLSEGQAQRIAIARALLRDAPILLLDEATSALDVETERKVLRNIMEDTYPRTCIVTTHRPTVLNICSRVYVIRNMKCQVLDSEEIERMIRDF